MAVLQPAPGPIVLPSDVERAVVAQLRAWVPYYLARVDEAQGLAPGTTKRPRHYDAASDNDRRWMEETPPSVLVVCPGTVSEPEQHGAAASYAAWWQVNVAVTASGATEAGSRELASRLGGAIVYAVTQQGDMDGVVQKTAWKGMRTDVISRQRPVMACEVACECFIRRVVDTRGPTIPTVAPIDPTDPADLLPQPDSLRVTVTPEEPEH